MAVILALILAVCLDPLTAFAQPNTGTPVKTTLCAIVKQPEIYSGKLVQFRATVEPGVYDLPASVTDDGCGAEVKLFTPDDPHLASLLKNREFRKLVKYLPKKPVVQATITGWFKGASVQPPGPRSGSGLLLESVAGVVALRNDSTLHSPSGSPQRKM